MMKKNPYFTLKLTYLNFKFLMIYTVETNQ